MRSGTREPLASSRSPRAVTSHRACYLRRRAPSAWRRASTSTSSQDPGVGGGVGDGVGVEDAVAVTVGGALAVALLVAVTVAVGLTDRVGVGVAVGGGVGVDEINGVRVGVALRVALAVRVGVLLRVGVNVRVGVAVRDGVRVMVPVRVAVNVGARGRAVGRGGRGRRRDRIDRVDAGQVVGLDRRAAPVEVGHRRHRRIGIRRVSEPEGVAELVGGDLGQVAGGPYRRSRPSRR